MTSATTSKNFDKAPRGYRLWRVSAKGKLSHEYVAVTGAPPSYEEKK